MDQKATFLSARQLPRTQKTYTVLATVIYASKAHAVAQTEMNTRSTLVALPLCPTGKAAATCTDLCATKYHLLHSYSSGAIIMTELAILYVCTHETSVKRFFHQCQLHRLTSDP